MIQTIIEAFDLAGGDAIGVVTRHGLAELRPVGSGTAPYVYADRNGRERIVELLADRSPDHRDKRTGIDMHQ